MSTKKKIITIIVSCVIAVSGICAYIRIEATKKSNVKFLDYNPSLQTESEVNINQNKSESQYTYPIDLNLATEDELISIDGIGPGTAEKILSYRSNNHGFKSITQLLDIDGIGEKKLSELQKYLYVANDTPQISTTTTKAKKVKKTDTENDSESTILNINTANKAQLMTLKNIGATKADAIISYRNSNGDFVYKQDITKVSGIGNDTYEQVKDYITTGYSEENETPPSAQNQTATQTQTATQKPAEQKSLYLSKIININTATQEDMINYLGLTSEESTEILNHKEKVQHPYTSKYELLMFISQEKLADIFYYIVLSDN